MTRHGLPAASTPAGTSRRTTLPAPTTESSPIVTAAAMTAAAPIQTFLPTAIGAPVLEHLLALARVERVRGRAELDRRPDERSLADAHGRDVEHDAVEVQEDAVPELDVPPESQKKGGSIQTF